jgi:DNA polymerase/3'-5' exonuclease PolX
MKIRVGSLTGGYWITFRTGEIKDLPEEIGKAYKLEEIKITEGNIGQTKVETKQIEKEMVEDYTPDNLFFNELTKIQGIGPKTAKDIVVYGTKEKLIEQINLKAELPFRDDIVKILEERYGQKL